MWWNRRFPFELTCVEMTPLRGSSYRKHKLSATGPWRIQITRITQKMNQCCSSCITWRSVCDPDDAPTTTPPPMTSGWLFLLPFWLTSLHHNSHTSQFPISPLSIYIQRCMHNHPQIVTSEPQSWQPSSAGAHTVWLHHQAARAAH